MTEKQVKKSSAKVFMPASSNGTVDWNGLLDQFAADDGTMLFVKKRVRVRLAPFEDPTRIFLPVRNFYQGKESTKYVCKVYYLEAKEGTSPVRAMLLSKRDVRAILQLQIEGWEIFDAELGHALALVRTGEGQQSNVTVTPSPKVRPLNEEELAELEEFDLDAAGETYSTLQERRAAQGNGNGKKARSDEETQEEEDYN